MILTMTWRIWLVVVVWYGETLLTKFTRTCICSTSQEKTTPPTCKTRFRSVGVMPEQLLTAQDQIGMEERQLSQTRHEATHASISRVADREIYSQVFFRPRSTPRQEQFIGRTKRWNRYTFGTTLVRLSPVGEEPPTATTAAVGSWQIETTTRRQAAFKRRPPARSTALLARAGAR